MARGTHHALKAFIMFLKRVKRYFVAFCATEQQIYVRWRYTNVAGRRKMFQPRRGTGRGRECEEISEHWIKSLAYIHFVEHIYSICTYKHRTETDKQTHPRRCIPKTLGFFCCETKSQIWGVLTTLRQPKRHINKHTLTHTLWIWY